MIVTAYAKVQTPNIDNTQKELLIDQNSYLQLVRPTTGNSSTATWSNPDMRIRRGATLSILEVGLATPAGIVNETNQLLFSLGYNDVIDTDLVKLYDSMVPFVPNGYTIGVDRDIEKFESGVNSSIVNLYCGFRVSLSTLGLPDEYNGAPIDVTPFVKLNIDERMVL